MNLPYLKLYVRDWAACPELRICSYAARGLWIDMMCLMAMSDRYGYLESRGKAITPDQLQRLTAGSVPVDDLLAELEMADVFSRDEKGIIYSRRMVKDVQMHDVFVKSGIKGGGNPALSPPAGEKKKPDEKPEDPDDGVPVWTLDKVLEVAARPTVAVTKAMAQSCFDHYNANGWVNNAGNQVAKTESGLASLLRKWKVAEPSMAAKNGGPPAAPSAPRSPNFDDVVVDVCRDLLEKKGDDVAFKRAMSVWRDKTKDIPRNRDGHTVLEEALDIIKHRSEKR